MKYRLPFFYDYVLANIVMPNATPIEMGVINYIHTLHSNRITSGSLFDQNIESQHSPIKTIFQDSLGVFPTSLGGYTHLEMQCYEDIVKIDKGSVCLGKTDRKKYIYPIKVSYHFEEFVGSHYNGNKLNGEFFWKHISEEVLEDARSGNATILLDWANENFISKESFKSLHLSIRSSKIPKEQIILFFNSFNADKIYDSWFPLEEQCLIVKNLPFLLSHTSHYYKDKFLNQPVISDFLETKNVFRKHKFLFKIRRSRNYRIGMLHALASSGLLSSGDWSCLDTISARDGLIKSKKYRDDLNIDIINELHKNLPHTLESEPGSRYENVMGWNDAHADASKTSYLYIASETFMTGEYKFFTEKVFKPIAHFQPFVFLSYPGALAELRNLGFKTFHPFIDESYDSEPDEVTRFNLIYKEIEKLCSLKTEDLHNWFWAMEEILIHNHTHLLKIYQNEPLSKELINFLHSQAGQ
jgi:hypothetical protein